MTCDDICGRLAIKIAERQQSQIVTFEFYFSVFPFWIALNESVCNLVKGMGDSLKETSVIPVKSCTSEL